MGCGHSKINIYPRKNKNKSSSKKSVTADKTESEEEDGLETEAETSEVIEDCDQHKSNKFKSLGGPLLAQPEISNSQRDFFRMLDEKIQNVPIINQAETLTATVKVRMNQQTIVMNKQFRRGKKFMKYWVKGHQMIIYGHDISGELASQWEMY